MKNLKPAWNMPCRLQLAIALAWALPLLAHAGVEIDQTPLTVGKPLEPNIMFIMDDSGSMRWQHMPGTAVEWYKSPPDGLPYPSDLKRDIRLRASNVNTQWYNPLITYSPWVRHDGSSWGDVDPRKARFDPSGTANTSNDQPGITKDFDLGSADWPSVDLDTSSTSTIDQEVWRYRGFYVLNPGGEPKNDQDYKRYEFRLKMKCTSWDKKKNCNKWAEAGGWEARVFSLKSDGTNNGDALSVTNFTWSDGEKSITRTVEEEVQNYANWFSYYRLRSSMAKAAASRVFSGLGEDYRVGYNTIWDRQNFPIPVETDKGLFKGSNKEEWFKRLFLTGTNQGTPLKQSLGRTGEYYRKLGADGPYGPESPQLSCRQNFAIMTTDGYWNSNEASNSNAKKDNDSTAGELIEAGDGKTYQYMPESPYKDGSSGRSNTLADVAMYYWKTDLTNLENNVPTTGMNPAFWQHMRTFGVSIGEKGTIDPAIDLSTVTSWPDPNDKEDAHRIDDLFHASVNSRGKFLVASNPEEFAKSLTEALATIGSETGRAASGAANSTSVDAGTMTFFTEYTSGTWSGDVRGYEIDPTTGKTSTTPGDGWAASEKLPAWNSRKIFFNQDGALSAFTWSNLNGTQRTALGTEDVVDFLRGDRSKEISGSSGTLRARDNPLGSFVNSQPVYVAKPSFGAFYENASTPGAADYKAHAAAKAARTPVLYVGGNDGMLHGFNAQTGEETFAFVPAGVITAALRGYADPDYEHRYFVDGELTVADAYLGKSWKTILVGSLGRGGKSVFALDVTDPAAVTLLWEKTASDIPALGNTLGKPIIAEVGPESDWRVVLGNGPNGAGDKAQLVTISLDGGAVSVIDTGVSGNNGLSAPLVWDADKNGTFETVYAGDLKGNVWRFDNIFADSPPTPFRLFTTDGNRPITASPWAAVNQRDLRTWVFVGTGQYLNEADRASTATQTWYGLIDEGGTIGARSAELVERSIGTTATIGGRKMRTLESGKASEMTGKKGWYIDFTETGERMITPNMFYGSALIGTTFVPDGSDLCKPGGRSALWGIDPFTGARLNKQLFSKFGTIDGKVDGIYPSVLDGLKPILVGNPPVTISEKDKVTTVVIHTDPNDSEEFSPPPGDAELQSWREVVGEE